MSNLLFSILIDVFMRSSCYQLLLLTRQVLLTGVSCGSLTRRRVGGGGVPQGVRDQHPCTLRRVALHLVLGHITLMKLSLHLMAVWK